MRPWVLRALVMTAVYGVGQAFFVAARAWAPDLTAVWTGTVLAVLLGVGIVWAGSEVVLGRRPEEWTWFRAALVAGPAAGVLSWALLGLFVDSSGVADLGSALVGRAAFTALLVLGSATVGSRLGWLALRQQGEGDDDPALDRDETDSTTAPWGRDRFVRGSEDARDSGESRAPRLDPRTVARVARLREANDRTGVADRDTAEVPGPSAAGVRLRPAPSGSEPTTEPTTGSGTGSREAGAGERARAGRAADPSYEPPVVAVLPETTDLPTRSALNDRDEAADEDQDPPRRRRFGLRRPR